MEMLFGLPAHPLVTHFPVVGIPLVSIAAIVLVFRPSTRETSGLGVAIFAVLTAGSSILAASSGEAFAELLSSGDEIDPHRQLGETLRIFAVLQAVSIIALVTSDRASNGGSTSTLTKVMSGLVVVSSALAVIWVIRTGHEGASQTWGFF